MARRATLTQVAREAGVSNAVVSLVLNGKDNGRFLAETVERVREASERLNYRADRRAQSLVTGRSRLVAVVLPAIDNPFYGELLSGIIEELGTEYQLIIVAAQPHQLVTAQNVEAALDLGVEGVLIATADHFEDTGVPTVILDRPDSGDPRPHINLDVQSSARALAAHLSQLGHARIRYIEADTPAASLTNRTDALRAALPAGTAFEVEHCAINLSAGHRMATERASVWSKDGATAIVCATDLQALGVLSGLQEAGFRVPEDFSLAGGDDIPYSRFVSPALTSVQLSAADFGRSAVARLRGLMEGDGGQPVLDVLPTQLVIRSSTGPARTA